MKFTAEIGGDQECFCFFVDKETFIKVMGQERYDADIAFDKESCKEIGQEFTEREKWAIYPNDLFGHFNRKTVEIEVKSGHAYELKPDGTIGIKQDGFKEVKVTI